MRIVFYIALLKLALAATVTYNWAITWVEANPDGHLTRPVIGLFYSPFLMIHSH
jgi:iron transport multicopper oxidase